MFDRVWYSLPLMASSAFPSQCCSSAAIAGRQQCTPRDTATCLSRASTKPLGSLTTQVGHQLPFRFPEQTTLPGTASHSCPRAQRHRNLVRLVLYDAERHCLASKEAICRIISVECACARP